MGVCGDGATADYLTTPAQLTPAGLLAEEMGTWTQNLAAFNTANASASSDNGYRNLNADSGWELRVEWGKTEVPDDSPLPTTVTGYKKLGIAQPPLQIQA